MSERDIFIKYIRKIFFIIILLIFAFYNIIAIYALSKTTILEENELCNKSNLWLYLLLSLIPNCVSFYVIFSYVNRPRLNIFIALYINNKY